MTSREELPRLYLDIDGTLLADAPLFDETVEFDLTRCAPELLRRLSQLPVDLVW